MAEQNTNLKHPETIWQFAFFPPNRDEAIASLASRAEPEDWTGTNNTGTPNAILKNYISYTYQRLRIEGKITVSNDRRYATFNTGLLTSHYDEIFGYFEQNHIERSQPWYFKGWVPESDVGLMRNFSDTPEMAVYVASAADLVYDTNKDLLLVTEHIVTGNIKRFPANLQNSPFAAGAALERAKALTLKRLKRNYKLAIPQWYPKLGQEGAQLLLPLDLTGNGTADLALVVSAFNESKYRGHTVLTLEMAYTNARLVARPNSEWLKPQATTPTDEEAAGTT